MSKYNLNKIVYTKTIFSNRIAIRASLVNNKNAYLMPIKWMNNPLFVMNYYISRVEKDMLTKLVYILWDNQLI